MQNQEKGKITFGKNKSMVLINSNLLNLRQIDEIISFLSKVRDINRSIVKLKLIIDKKYQNLILSKEIKESFEKIRDTIFKSKNFPFSDEVTFYLADLFYNLKRYFSGTMLSSTDIIKKIVDTEEKVRYLLYLGYFYEIFRKNSFRKEKLLILDSISESAFYVYKGNFFNKEFIGFIKFLIKRESLSFLASLLKKYIYFRYLFEVFFSNLFLYVYLEKTFRISHICDEIYELSVSVSRRLNSLNKISFSLNNNEILEDDLSKFSLNPKYYSNMIDKYALLKKLVKIYLFGDLDKLNPNLLKITSEIVYLFFIYYMLSFNNILYVKDKRLIDLMKSYGKVYSIAFKFNGKLEIVSV